MPGGLTHISVPGRIFPRRVSTLSTSLGRSPGTRSMDGNTSSPRPVPARSTAELWPSPCWRGSHWPPPPLPARALCLRRRRLRTSASPGTRSRQCLQQEVSRAPWSVSYMCTPPRCRPPPPWPPRMSPGTWTSPPALAPCRRWSRQTRSSPPPGQGRGRGRRGHHTGRCVYLRQPRGQYRPVSQSVNIMYGERKSKHCQNKSRVILFLKTIFPPLKCPSSQLVFPLNIVRLLPHSRTGSTKSRTASTSSRLRTATGPGKRWRTCSAPCRDLRSSTWSTTSCLRRWWWHSADKSDQI